VENTHWKNFKDSDCWSELNKKYCLDQCLKIEREGLDVGPASPGAEGSGTAQTARRMRADTVEDSSTTVQNVDMVRTGRFGKHRSAPMVPAAARSSKEGSQKTFEGVGNGKFS
jgi:hypothetical protein